MTIVTDMSSLSLPKSSSTVQVSIIDTTAQLKDIPASFFLGPAVEGFDKFVACAFAFLVTHTDEGGKERRIVFDLGPPKDWENDLAEPVVKDLRVWGATFDITKYVSEILEENGVSLDSIEAVIWSHAHWDHTGRVSLFPSSVDLIVGPGLKSAYYPGYPTVPDTSILERDFADRKVTELDFSTSSLEVAGFKAIDYFNDGSFYLLFAPGHAVGHVNALARTTSSSDHNSQSTFILMGADSYHHGSQIRPSHGVALPEDIPGPIPHFHQYTSICPGHIFDVIHPSNPHRKETIPPHYTATMEASHTDPRTSSYFTIGVTPEGGSVAIDIQAARDVISRLQDLDAEENVFLVSAHDSSLYDVLEFFPKAANGWKEKGWKEKGRWRFLGDLKTAVEIANGQAAK